MNELINLITKKTGVSAVVASTIITLVVGFLKRKLPASASGQIDKALENDSIAHKAEDLISDLTSKISKKRK